MKSIIALACIFCAFACIAQTLAMPYPEAEAEAAYIEATNLADSDALALEDHSGHRQKRATCDLLSFTGANHAACAAHCVLRGNHGGYCNNKAVCVCRN